MDLFKETFIAVNGFLVDPFVDIYEFGSKLKHGILVEIM